VREDIPSEISVPEWWHNGRWLIRRDALEPEHPESTYGYIKRVLGLRPEEYGVRGPRADQRQEAEEPNG
jgi:hypothetical protein